MAMVTERIIIDMTKSNHLRQDFKFLLRRMLTINCQRNKCSMKDLLSGWEEDGLLRETMYLIMMFQISTQLTIGSKTIQFFSLKFSLEQRKFSSVIAEVISDHTMMGLTESPHMRMVNSYTNQRNQLILFWKEDLLIICFYSHLELLQRATTCFFFPSVTIAYFYQEQLQLWTTSPSMLNSFHTPSK